MDHIAIIGFGSQAKSWALNLRDSGYHVCILLRENSPSKDLVKSLGFQYSILNKLTEEANIALLIPDDKHKEFFENNFQYFNTGSRFIYAHGYSVSNQEIDICYPQFEHLLLAPKAIASELRYEYETKGKLVAAYSITQNKNEKDNEHFLMKLSRGLGINVGPFKTSFLEETNCDLFSEQSILCSLIPYGILNSFNTLVEAGHNENLAFIECWHETKLIANTLINIGPEEFFKLISPNALLGGDIAKDKLFDDHYRLKLTELLSDIKNKKFQNTVNDTDIRKVREQILSFWKDQRLTQVYKVFKDEYGLY